MSTYFKYLILVFIAFFAINCVVFAEELDYNDQTEVVNQVPNDEESLEPTEDANALEMVNSDLEFLESEETTTSEIQLQKVKVIISKVDEEGNPLSGAKLQIIDSNNNVVDEWTSDGEKHSIMLPDGKYILHETEAPEGYDLAEDKEFTVTVVVEVGYKANTEYPNIPCEAATIYYVEVEGKRHEVYCINQFLTEPGPDADYNGKILTADDIRNYTQQTVLEDPYANPGGEGAVSGHGHLTENPIDVSDQTLSDQELYDTVLNIIYRRTLARKQDRFADEEALPDEAISFLTEMALKTYTNAGVTQIQRWDKLQSGEEAVYVQEGKYYWYLMHMYKDYVYDPDSPNGFRTEIGHGDALGNFARHWTINKPLHETRNLSVDHPIYADYFYFLMGDDVSRSLIHPEDMHIYIYQAANVLDDDEGFQNLLGITGYLEDFEPQEQEVEMVNNYSTKKRNISVTKVWNDKENYDGKRADNVTVNLYADGSIIDSVELNEANNWQHTWTDLDIYQKGEEIKYTVDENKIEEYVTVIEGDMDNGFTIINSIPETEPHNNPYTEDNVYAYMLMLLIGLIGLGRYTYSYAKNN